MSKKFIFCIAPSLPQANQIVDCLQDEGFSSNEVSALLPDKTNTRDFAHRKGTKTPEGLTSGAGGGAVLGGALGWLAGIGALAIPGFSPFVAAGPIGAGLSGAAVGGTVGGIAGALIGMGIPARRHEEKLKEGGILISVHTESVEEVKRVKKILRQSAENLLVFQSTCPLS
jgi:hypothetical protein